MLRNFLFITVLFFMFPPNAFADSEDGMLRDAIVNEIAKKITDTRITIEVSFNSDKQAREIDKRFDNVANLELEKFDPKFSTFKAKIIFFNGEKQDISGKYFSMIDAPVAARYIKFNDVINASDISSTRVRTDRIKSEYAHDASDVIGMKAKKYIPVGSMFNMIDLMTPPVIKIGDPVNIVYSSGVISLKTNGTSLAAGAIGDMIKVKNTSSGAVLLGEIVNSNTVKIGGKNE